MDMIDEAVQDGRNIIYAESTNMDEIEHENVR